MWKIIAALIVVLIVWYALAGRKWLKAQPWAEGFFAVVEPIEIALYRKSETLLVGRLLSVGSFIVTSYDALAMLAPSLDLTPITARLLAPVPPDMRGMVASGLLMLVGLAITWLRKRTSKPLEVVAASDDDPMTALANAKVETTNAQAVAAVTQ